MPMSLLATRPLAIRLLTLLPLAALPTGTALADPAAAQACAGQLSKDARTIFDTTLPQLGASTDLRGLVTDTTRTLAASGRIDRATARSSAIAAGQCLRLAHP
jgi:hypothetical protein